MKAKSHSKKSTSSLSTIMVLLRVDDLGLAPSKECMYLRDLKWMLGSEFDKKEK